MQAVGGALIPIVKDLLSNPIYKAGFDAAGIALKDLGPKPNNGVAPWAWNWPGSTIAGSWTDNPQAYQMVPSLEQGYNQTLQHADTYGVNGYTGISSDIKAKPNGLYRWTGVFMRNEP